MRVAVMGAGAVGCYFGGLLARAGHEVLFIGRPDHVAAINAHGLLMETKTFTAHAPAKASTEAAAIDQPDLLLFCVKSGDTETAGRALAERLGSDTIVLSLQNGVDNADRLAAVLGRPVLPAIVYAGVEMAGPGHVKHQGGGMLVVGASARSAELATTFSAAGIPTTVRPDIATALWVKLIVNCAYNALSAAGPLPYGPMMQTPGVREVVADAVAECAAVAQACGVALPADILATTLALADSMPGQMSSTAQDILRGKPTEIDFLNGYVVRKGAELGVATPTNRALQVMVHLAEQGRAARA